MICLDILIQTSSKFNITGEYNQRPNIMISVDKMKINFNCSFLYCEICTCWQYNGYSAESGIDVESSVPALVFIIHMHHFSSSSHG